MSNGVAKEGERAADDYPPHLAMLVFDGFPAPVRVTIHNTALCYNIRYIEECLSALGVEKTIALIAKHDRETRMRGAH